MHLWLYIPQYYTRYSFQWISLFIFYVTSTIPLRPYWPCTSYQSPWCQKSPTLERPYQSILAVQARHIPIQQSTAKFHSWNKCCLLGQKQQLLLPPLLHQLTKFTEICFHSYSQKNLHIFNTELSLFSFWGRPLFLLQREVTCRKLFLVLIHSSLFTVIQNSCLYYKWLTFSSFWFRSLSCTSHLNYLSSSNF